MNFRLQIAKNIARLRKQRGLTQAELAGLSGVSRSYISRIERGRCDFTLDVLERLAAALEVDVVALVAPEQREQRHVAKL